MKLVIRSCVVLCTVFVVGCGGAGSSGKMTPPCDGTFILNAASQTGCDYGQTAAGTIGVDGYTYVAGKGNQPELSFQISAVGAGSYSCDGGKVVVTYVDANGDSWMAGPPSSPPMPSLTGTCDISIAQETAGAVSFSMTATVVRPAPGGTSFISTMVSANGQVNAPH